MIYFNTSPDKLGEAFVSLKLIPPEAKDEVFFAEEDWLVSDAMCKMWATFARTGDPNIEGLVEWPVYKTATDEYIFIVWPLEVKSGFSQIKFEDAD
ncbi:MAG: hypothetical protein A2Z15_06450 [Chloroflexi bacterium RBG_16_50_11]|nr:MAG: hypothetical protein A2Z15_06450 [Chloroflexi bacterium RBG_16_50_11]